MFKVGDRVVVIGVTDTMTDLIGKRGRITAILASETYVFNIEVAVDGWEGVLCKPEELELEAVYDALSAPPPVEEPSEVSSFWDSKVDMSDEDVINHPSHYADGWSNGAEVIDIVENLNFNRGNACKYLTRAGKKGGSEKELEDLQKALWYVTREVQRLGGTT